MYKTSAVYNAFVCYKLSVGTKLEVRLGSKEMIVQTERASWLLFDQHVMLYLIQLLSDAQRWPMGFDGSVRLGWKARCMDC